MADVPDVPMESVGVHRSADGPITSLAQPRHHVRVELADEAQLITWDGEASERGTLPRSGAWGLESRLGCTRDPSAGPKRGPARRQCNESQYPRHNATEDLAH